MRGLLSVAIWLVAFACLALCFGNVHASEMVASYYGAESGSRTASGAPFRPSGLTAAHRTLPFGTRLRVTYRGRSVIVVISDRGPFIKGRSLDLSAGAARAIGLIAAGVGRVEVERL